MSGDEVIVLLASGAFSIFAWIAWYAHPVGIKRKIGRASCRESV